MYDTSTTIIKCLRVIIQYYLVPHSAHMAFDGEQIPST